MKGSFCESLKINLYIDIWRRILKYMMIPNWKTIVKSLKIDSN